MAKAYGYTRTTYEDRFDEVTISEHHRDIEDYVKTRLSGWEFVGIAQDPCTQQKKKFRKRRQGSVLFKRLETKDVIVIADTPRAFLSLQDFKQTVTIWIYRGVFVVLLDLGIDTRHKEQREILPQMMSLLLRFNEQMEREKPKPRKLCPNSPTDIKYSIKRFDARQPPLGWMVVKNEVGLEHLAPCHAEREMIEKIIQWAFVTKRSNKQILHKIDLRNWKRSNGHNWTVGMIKEVRAKRMDCIPKDPYTSPAKTEHQKTLNLAARIARRLFRKAMREQKKKESQCQTNTSPPLDCS